MRISGVKEGGFRDFEQRDYDFEALEKAARSTKDISSNYTPQAKTIPEETVAETKATYRAQKMDELKTMLNEGVREVMEGERFKNYLKTCSLSATSGRYSERNVLLMAYQKANVGHVAGYQAWKYYGRQVKKGATGLLIYAPQMAYENKKGALATAIVSSLKKGVKEHGNGEYGLNASLSFTLKNGVYGMERNGKGIMSFASEAQMKDYISSHIVDKEPVAFVPTTVFDVSDTVVPEHLFVKSGYSKADLALNENGEPIKNKLGEVKIINTPERQARFEEMSFEALPSCDPKKMEVLYEALKAVAGVRVSEESKEVNKDLTDSCQGYYMFATPRQEAHIVIKSELPVTDKVAVLLHETAHAKLHNKENLATLATTLQEERVTSSMKEIQAEAVAYAVAQNFGIETKCNSFDYLAAYSKDLKLDELNKSMSVIYNEVQKTTKEIRGELAKKGYDLNITPLKDKAKDKEKVENAKKSKTTAQKTKKKKERER